MYSHFYNRILFCSGLFTCGVYTIEFITRYFALLLLQCLTKSIVISMLTVITFCQKYTDTNSDPHNSKRGFWFSHMLWLVSPRHKDLKDKLQTFEMNDLEKDPVVRFQSKYDLHKIYLMIYVLLYLMVLTLLFF